MQDTSGIDFTLDSKRRRMLYYKRPKGSGIPVGSPWKCICGAANILNDKPDQYCQNCGSRLRLQESDNDHPYHTVVIVSHFAMKAAPSK